VSLAFYLGCGAAPSMGSFIAFRFLSGLFGVPPLSLAGGSVGDMFAIKDRASAMSLCTLGPFLGSSLSPIVGSFVVQALGYRWLFIITAGLDLILAFVSILFMDESYAPIVRIKRDAASKIPEKVKNARRHHGSDVQVNRWKFLCISLSRPIILLTRSLICFSMGLYMALVYSTFYLMVTTFDELFTNTYGFGVGISGLPYLGLCAGFILASVLGPLIMRKIYAHCQAKNNGIGTPEMRIPALILASLFIPIGLLWYGWSAQAKLHWIMPIIGTGIFGFGLMTSFLPITVYLLDSFTYVASAMSALSVFRNLLGFVLSLYGNQMYDAMGLGGGNSLLAGLAIVIGIPFPVWLWYKGEEIRSRNPLNR